MNCNHILAVLSVLCIALLIVIASMMRDLKCQATEMELKVDSMAQELNVRKRELRESHLQLEYHKQKETQTQPPPPAGPFSCGDHWFLDTFGTRTLTLIDAITKETFVEPIVEDLVDFIQ